MTPHAAQFPNTIVDRLTSVDPVYWVEKHLTVDGKPLRIHGNGYKPFADIYRYIGIKALEKNSLPVVMVKGRQVGATLMASALEMFFVGCGLFGGNNKPPIRVVHAFPQLDVAFIYSKVKLNGIISSSVMPDDQLPVKGQKAKSCMQLLLDSSSPTNDSLQFKQFVGGNFLMIESVGIDGNRLRGRTADVLLCDEVQDMPAAAISNSTKILTKAQYGAIGSGIQVYFGTPKQRNSEYYNMWNSSTQQYYYLGCEKCKKHFPLYTPNSNEWENIWIYGYIVRCTHCGFEQDKRQAAERGKWVATRSLSDSKFIGFHINQLYVPDYTREKIESEKPGISTINTERSFQNEVMGEFYHGESAILTPDQIREFCGDSERKFRASVPSDEGTLTFLGIDIGEKNDMEALVDSDKIKTKGQSYSTAVVLAISGAQRMEIIFATKFKRNDFASKKGLIEELMRKYSIQLGVIDLGYTRDLSETLQMEYGSKMLSSVVSSKVNDRIRYNEDVFPKTITFEKDYWIAEMFDQLKKGNVRFPLGSYEQCVWLMQHCTNFEIKPSISRTGDVMPHYVKSGHTDGFMALLNAYLAFKFHISSGFSIKHPLLMKNSDKKPGPLAVLGKVKF